MEIDKVIHIKTPCIYVEEESHVLRESTVYLGVMQEDIKNKRRKFPGPRIERW